MNHVNLLNDSSLIQSPQGARRRVLANSALYALYGEQLWTTNLSLSALNLSFGDPKDGFYTDIHTNSGYLSW